MPAYAETGGGGDGSTFRPEEGQTPGVLAEVIGTGYKVNPNYPEKGEKPTCKAVFILPEDLLGDDAPDGKAGEPKLVYWFVDNFKITCNDDPQWRSAYEKALAVWLGKSVPASQQNRFCFGRDLGTGEDEWNPDLKPAEMKKQFAEKFGIPVGARALLNLVHHENKAGKVYANPGPTSPPSAEKWCESEGKTLTEYAAWVENEWQPGIGPADKNAKRYSLNAKRKLLKDGKPTGYTYTLDAEREAQKSARAGKQQGGGQEQQLTQKTFEEPEDDEDSIPF